MAGHDDGTLVTMGATTEENALHVEEVCNTLGLTPTGVIKLMICCHDAQTRIYVWSCKCRNTVHTQNRRRKLDKKTMYAWTWDAGKILPESEYFALSGQRCESEHFARSGQRREFIKKVFSEEIPNVEWKNFILNNPPVFVIQTMREQMLELVSVAKDRRKKRRLLGTLEVLTRAINEKSSPPSEEEHASWENPINEISSPPSEEEHASWENLGISNLMLAQVEGNMLAQV